MLINKQETDSIIIMTKTLYNFLLPRNDMKFYSYSLKHVSSKTRIPIENILKFDNKKDTNESKIFRLITNDHINIFNYNGIVYVGLETERLRYERDAKSGNNYVERLIANGVYK